MKSLLWVLFFLPVTSFAKNQVIFLVNTKEHDIRGAVTAPYLDEDADRKVWRKLYPDAHLYTIRANSIEEMRKGLEVAMANPPEDKEVLGLFIRSHGERMKLYNEQLTFQLHFPEDLPQAFGPIIGKFSDNALIAFNACSILEDMNVSEAQNSLLQITSALGMKDGRIYANRTPGYEGLRSALRTDVRNKDIPALQRGIAGLFYVAFPITVPTAWLMEKGFNRGYLMEVHGTEAKTVKTDYFSVLKF